MIFSVLPRSFVSLAAAASLSFAQSPFPDSTTCDKSCQDLAVDSSSWIAEQQADPTFGFYKTPSNFSDDFDPGLILTVEDATNLTNYLVPSGLTMSRIIYTTEDIDGKVIPASAYILWPYGAYSTGSKAAQQGMPMVAWAHGTTGTFQPCAPSSYRALQYHFQVPFALALQGIAVVAPDYAGLGVSKLPSGKTIPHPWVTAPAHANDLAYAVQAARSAFPDYLRPAGSFVAMGHSQGGGAAWAFAERQAKKPLKGYQGTVSIAPVTRILDDLAYFADNSIIAPVLFGQPVLIDSVSKIYPEYNYTGLTATSYDRWHNVLAKVKGCFPVLQQVYSDVQPSEIAKPEWYKEPIPKKWAERVQAGRKQFAGPLLVLSGKSDHVVRQEGIEAAVKDTCNLAGKSGAKQSLEHVTYSEMDHFPVIQASQMKWMGWIKDRLSGKRLETKGCSSEVEPGFRTDHTVQTSTPNFFLSFFNAEESWKYGL
ncbi:secretory lipase [Fusarium albosuccineum]|uniref:Secretory lipase n=1 Tax=Fusarium albosuccineum TaxID=1237068 RepID=A0A8H4L203_9HYPO|nr:secretory lipase [Fusarium albosuccineum]